MEASNPSEKLATKLCSKRSTVPLRRGTDTAREHSWFFLNKSGSKWGGEVCIELENFKRGYGIKLDYMYIYRWVYQLVGVLTAE